MNTNDKNFTSRTSLKGLMRHLLRALVLFGLLFLPAGQLLAQSCGGTGNPSSCGGSPGSPSCGCPSTGAGNPIDLISGNKYLEVADFALPGELSVGFTRHYNSLSSDAPGFGNGWSHGFESRLTRTESAASNGQKPSVTIRLTQGDGRELVFRPLGAPRDGVQRYVASRRSAGILEERIADIDRAYQLRTASAAARAAVGEIRPWTWRWPNGRRVGFDIRGVMHGIADPNGDRLRLTHDANARLVSVTDTAGRELRFSYWDEAGQTLGRFDGKGPSLAGAAERIRAVRQPDGSNIEYFYDGGGLLSLVRYPDGRELRYSYSSIGHRKVLTKIEDRNRQVLAAYAYDESGYAVSTQQAGGANAIKVGYRESATVKGLTETWLTNARGESTVYRWRAGITERDAQLIDAYGPGCSTCPESNIRYSYDKSDNITKVERLEEGTLKAPGRVLTTERYERDEQGRLTAVYRAANGEPEALFERYVYRGVDPLELPARIERPSIAGGDWHVLAFEYNTRGQPITLRESGFSPSSIAGIAATKIARTTAFSYFEFADGQPALVGRLKSIDGPLPGANDTIRYEYDARGLLTTVRHPLGATETYRYDSLGRLEEMVPLDGVAVRLEYDTSGRVAAFLRANLRSAMTYDEHGRIATIADPVGQRFKFGYDGASRLTSITDTDGFKIVLDIDPDGRAVARRLLNPDGSVSQETFATPEDQLLAKELTQSRWSAALSVALRLPSTTQWNSSAEATLAPFYASLDPETVRAAVRVDDERGLSSMYEYDDFGRLVRIENPDSGSIHVSYDESNRVRMRADGNGLVVEYRYDLLGRPVAIVSPDEQVLIEFGQSGKPRRIRYRAGAEELRYDAFGRLRDRTRLIDGKKFVTRYDYDALGRVAASTLPDGQVLEYRYNATVASKPGVLNAILRRDLIGSTIVVEGLNEISDTFDRQTSKFGNGLTFVRELDKRGHVRRFGTKGVAEFSFALGDGGQINGANSSSQQAFQYDDAGRVIGTSQQSPTTRRSLGLAYDLADNVLSRVRNSQIERFVVDEFSNRVVRRVDAEGDEVEYAYDGAGRTTAVGDRRFRYDGAGRLVEILDREKTVARYAYNGFGERIKKVSYNGNRTTVTYFFYDDSKLTAEADGDGRITKQYVYVEDRPTAVLVGRDIYAVHTDWRGAPLAVTDRSQSIVWKADVGVWHDARVELSKWEFNLRGSNQYFDAESGLHYNYHRYFDTESGRYLTPDPIGQSGGLNLYAFVEGDPVNFVDPLGLQRLTTDAQVANASFTDKLGETFRRAIEQASLPSASAVVQGLRGALQQAVDDLPQTVAMFVAWQIVSATPLGWLANGLMAAYAAYSLGADALALIRNLGSWVMAVSNATTCAQLTAAARQLLNILAQLGNLAANTFMSLRGSGRRPTSANAVANNAAPRQSAARVIVRLTRLVAPCFNPFAGRNPTFNAMTPAQRQQYLREYNRQLLRQERAIGEMTADQFAAARQHYEQFGRNAFARGAQQRARDEFERAMRTSIENSLRARRTDLTPAQIAQHASDQARDNMRRLAALHEPDNIAGGVFESDPARFGRSDVNSHIGSSWRSLIGELDRAAGDARSSGQGSVRMNVRLRLASGPGGCQ